ncbi:unnamed protein product [Nippostrongylus brasiliensis]|uniref:GLOBIN domain-containing protein n=1 Tax=Nippostrongylus brasiliensis TaxID=27835 RepID=A0A158R019_NIPBR|nr:unnamed protein product [Nippostrongylus brasiliensis]
MVGKSGGSQSGVVAFDESMNAARISQEMISQTNGNHWNSIKQAWLKAAELTPTWVWALVDLPETMHANYKENARFLNLIQQVRDFLHLLIKVHRCDTEMIKTLAFRLGARHKFLLFRGYMNEGHDNSYWAPFAQQLPIAIAATYMDVVSHDNKIRRIFRVRVHADRSEEEELIDSWRQLMNTIVESMKRGYEGCASQKTPMRLSITKSVVLDLFQGQLLIYSNFRSSIYRKNTCHRTFLNHMQSNLKYIKTHLCF